jgi:hypothetical protein
MFKRLKEILTRKASPALSSEPIELYSPNIKELSFEVLWDDYEKRTWHYGTAPQTLSLTDQRLLNWIGSIDHSGYTREKCLRALITNYLPGDENRILLRLADWVPQIQDLARDWTIAQFRSLPPESIYALQGLLLYLSRKDLLQNDAGLQEITRELLERTRSMTAPEFFRFNALFRKFLFSRSLAEDGQLRQWILDDPYPFNRLLLISKVSLSALTKREIERYKTDKSVFVRRRFFYAQLDAGITPPKEHLIAFALDSSRSLRQLGQFYLKELYGEDAYAIYRAKGGAELYFIADYRRKEDSDLFLHGIRSGSRSIQYNCLRALMSVAQERLAELDLAALISQNQRIRSTLLPILPQIMSLDEILALRAIFDANSAREALSFLNLLEKKSFWAFVDEGLDFLMRDSPLAIKQFMVQTIQSKIQICESLPANRRASIIDKITKLHSDPKKRDEHLLQMLEFMIKTAS